MRKVRVYLLIVISNGNEAMQDSSTHFGDGLYQRTALGTSPNSYYTLILLKYSYTSMNTLKDGTYFSAKVAY